MLITILIILLILSLFGGVFGYSRAGYLGFSPVGIILIILLILYLTGNLHWKENL